METIKIKWHPQNTKLCQVPSKGMQFAFVSKDHRQVHQLVLCKDFLTDIVYGSISQNKFDIYELHFDPKLAPPLDFDTTRIIVTNGSDKQFGETLVKCLDLVHHVEKRLGMTPTKVSKCTGVPPAYRFSGVWMLESDKRWMIAPPMLSFFSFVLRIGMIHKEGDTIEQTMENISSLRVIPYYWSVNNSTDRDIACRSSCVKFIQKLLRVTEKPFFGENINDNYRTKNREERIYNIHDDCGLQSFTMHQSEYYFPNWYKEELF